MATPLRNRDDGEAPASLLSILSFNTFKLLDLAGLPALLRENRPHFVFLQEVAPSVQLLAVAAAAGYTAYKSVSVSPRRIMAVLSRVPDVQVSDLEAGYVQFLQWGPLSFVHVHLPSGNKEHVAREAMIRRLRPRLRLPVPPIILGDFNCVLHQLDTEDDRFRVNYRFSQALEDTVSEFRYMDSFGVLHPCARAFSWHRQGQLSSRYDRAYIPPS